MIRKNQVKLMLLKCEKHNNYLHTSLLTSAKSPCYRYGFNGMEKDDEHTQGKYDFGARIYDSRLGRWLAVDPLSKRHAGNTPLRHFLIALYFS